MIEGTVLYRELQAHFGILRADQKGENWTTCPFCGKGGKHFSFSASGYNCFHCGQKGSLWDLAERERVADMTGRPKPVYSQQEPKVREAPFWTKKGIEHTLNHPKRYEAWAAYKPISRASIDKYQLGYGKLWFQRENGEWYQSQCEWLTVPLFSPNGELVGMRGRNTGTQGPKWISATGTRYMLWNAANIRDGHVVWITENYVDAIMVMEAYPEYDAVAIGGASTWKNEWSYIVKAKHPFGVIVALDNDLAGQASGAMYEALVSRWQEEHPGLTTPTPNGPKIVHSLRMAGVRAVAHDWKDSPAKYDIGQKLIDTGSLDDD